MTILDQLRRAFAAATPEGGDPLAFAAAVRPSTDAKFGDYQANGCMPIAKARKANPREVAQRVADAVELEPLAGTPEIAGAGFLNVRIRDEWLSKALAARLDDPTLGIEPPAEPKTVVIDYSSPNVAKPMHVGHIRSTVIGECLARMYAALGHKVVRDNHLGDWGAQFGMILHGWKSFRDDAAYDADPVGELSRLYRTVAGKIKVGETIESTFGKVFKLADEGKAAEAEALLEKLSTPDDAEKAKEVAALLAKIPAGPNGRIADLREAMAASKVVANAARGETVGLHAGNAENRALWSQFMPNCLEALHEIYKRLGVRFDVELGESFYDPMLKDVVDELESKGLATQSDGALVIFTEASKAPFIVRKRDGAYNYATTDLATILYRENTWNPDLILYVVDHRQGDHFKQLFEVAKKWGHAAMRLEHVAFGTILGNDRKPFKTRDGDVVGLESLLDEAIAEARKVVDENSSHLPEETRKQISEAVGLGAIKYADLSQNRLSDYVFDWKKMMAVNGNSGAYLQYAYARIQNIFRKGETTPEAIRAAGAEIRLDSPSERAMGLQILRFPEVVEMAAAELKPNVLTDYLFDLANKLSTFYDECPVLRAESEEVKNSRLALCDLTGRTLAAGLEMLGINVVERM